MISKEEVKRIAKLARLELTEKEIEKMQKDLSEILDYFNLLKDVPVTKKGESAFVKNIAWRADEEASNHDVANELIKLAPDKKDGYIKVKEIL